MKKIFLLLLVLIICISVSAREQDPIKNKVQNIPDIQEYCLFHPLSGQAPKQMTPIQITKPIKPKIISS